VARRIYRESYHRATGVAGLFGTAYIGVGSSVFFALGVVALHALGAAPAVLLVAALVFALIAFSYAEATTALPGLGGAAGFGQRAFDQLTGFLAGWTLLLDYILLLAIATLFVPHYLGVFWSQLAQAPYDGIVAVAALALLVVLNIAGFEVSSRLDTVVAVFTLATQTLLVVIGLVLLFEPRLLVTQIDVGRAPTWGQLLYPLPLVVAAFAGIDAAADKARDVATAGRGFSRTLGLLLPVVVVTYLGLATVAVTALPVGSNVLPIDAATGLTAPVAVLSGLSQDRYVLAADPSTEVFLPVEKQGTQLVVAARKPTGRVYEEGGRLVTRVYGTRLGSVYLDDPLQGIVAALPADKAWLADVVRPWVAAIGAGILLLLANAVLGGSSRLVYALARNRQLPAVLGRVYASRMTPYVALIAASVAAAALAAPGSITLLVELFGFGALVSFTLVHLSVVALRYKEPGLARPFRMPCNIRFRGGSVPALAVVGALSTASIWVTMVATHSVGRLVGIGWTAGGVLMYVVYRLASGYPLLKPAEVARMPATAVIDIDYDQILVPIVGSRLTDEMMVLACQLATEKASSIDALYVMEVPMRRALDELPEIERRRAEKVMQSTAAITADFGVEIRPHIAAARHAGRAIVEMAAERKSDVIILGAVRKRRISDRIFGDTVAYVLRHAPCEVIVNLVPADYPMNGSADEIQAQLTGGPGGDAASDTEERE